MNLTLNEDLVPAMSDTFQWMTLLTIHRSNVTFTEVLNLSSIANLGALELCKLGAEVVNDNLLRSWSRAVFDDGAFARLRVLRIRNCPGITGQVFNYLLGFPALEYFCEGKTSINSAETSRVRHTGWSRWVPEDPRLEDVPLNGAPVGSLARYYYEAVHSPNALYQSPEGDRSLPVLDLWLDTSSARKFLAKYPIEKMVLYRRVAISKKLSTLISKTLKDFRAQNPRTLNNSPRRRRPLRRGRQQELGKVLGDFEMTNAEPGGR